MDDGKNRNIRENSVCNWRKGNIFTITSCIFCRFDCLANEMLYIPQIIPPLNEHTDSGADPGFFNGGWLRPIGHQITRKLISSCSTYVCPKTWRFRKDELETVSLQGLETPQNRRKRFQK